MADPETTQEPTQEPTTFSFPVVTVVAKKDLSFKEAFDEVITATKESNHFIALDLSQMNITDRDTPRIAEFIKAQKNVVGLILDGNEEITDKGADNVKMTLQENPLCKVSFKNTQVSAEKKQEITELFQLVQNVNQQEAKSRQEEKTKETQEKAWQEIHRQYSSFQSIDAPTSEDLSKLLTVLHRFESNAHDHSNEEEISFWLSECFTQLQQTKPWPQQSQNQPNEQHSLKRFIQWIPTHMTLT